MSNFGTKVITGRLPQSVPITYFIELFTKFSSAGSCYYIQTLLSWQGDKLQNITHTVTELLHLYSWCLVFTPGDSDLWQCAPWPSLAWRRRAGRSSCRCPRPGSCLSPGGSAAHSAALQWSAACGQRTAAPCCWLSSESLQSPCRECPRPGNNKSALGIEFRNGPNLGAQVDTADHLEPLTWNQLWKLWNVQKVKYFYFKISTVIFPPMNIKSAYIYGIHLFVPS